MEAIRVQKVREDAQMPVRASDGAVGYDVFASVVLSKETKEVWAELPYRLEPGESILVGTGVRMAVPWPVQCEVRPRSGLANKFDIELSNSPGTIDPDFRGEAGILLRNRGRRSFVIEKDMRIAQLVFSKVEIPILELADELPLTRRGSGGFGSTGLYGQGLGISDYQRVILEQDRYHMDIAILVSKKSGCVRGCRKIDDKYPRDKRGWLIGQKRRVGCIFVSEGGVIFAEGFNNPRPGVPSCEEVGCLRDRLGIPSGTQLEKCQAIHAEEWGLSNAAREGYRTKGSKLVITHEPCEKCSTMLVNAGIETVVIPRGTYPTNGVQILKDALINIRYLDMGYLDEI